MTEIFYEKNKKSFRDSSPKKKVHFPWLHGPCAWCCCKKKQKKLRATLRAEVDVIGVQQC